MATATFHTCPASRITVSKGERREWVVAVAPPAGKVWNLPGTPWLADAPVIRTLSRRCDALRYAADAARNLDRLLRGLPSNGWSSLPGLVDKPR